MTNYITSSRSNERSIQGGAASALDTYRAITFISDIRVMGFRVPALVQAKQIIRRLTAASEIPRGHLAVYVGESQKRPFLIPVSFLKHPHFKNC
ncbi:Small auxin-up RNA - like 10 [Theobroma cacao]|nr:Small auxin-up RNA - like 10 [Theobroma cacao]